MKQLASILAVFLFALNSDAQIDGPASWLRSILNDEQLSSVDHKALMTTFNFAPLWTSTENSNVFGFIGDNYQRLRIKIISISQDRKLPDTYTVSGKSMVKNVIRTFAGTVKITHVRVYDDPRLGIDDEYKNKIKERGVVVGEYHLSEDKRKKETGIFEGVFATYWYVDRDGHLRYDDINAGADGYLNNQFVGTWTSYKTRVGKIANWGDYRIPLSGDLDIGAGDLSPDDKYLPYGWRSYREAYSNNSKRARLEEDRKWWK